MRRALQSHLERHPDPAANGHLDLPSLHEALEEMLFHSGTLNARLLGAQPHSHSLTPPAQ